MTIRKNPDGSISVGVLNDFAMDMNPPVEAPTAEAVEAEKKPVKKPATRKPKK